MGGVVTASLTPFFGKALWMGHSFLRGGRNLSGGALAWLAVDPSRNLTNEDQEEEWRS